MPRKGQSPVGATQQVGHSLVTHSPSLSQHPSQTASPFFFFLSFYFKKDIQVAYLNMPPIPGWHYTGVADSLYTFLYFKSISKITITQ